MKGYSKMGDEKMVKSCKEPASSFSQMYKQAPLMYKERQEKAMAKQASKLKAQDFKGRY